MPQLLAAERPSDGTPLMVLEAIEGETIAGKIQRDEVFATARLHPVADLGTALARLHSPRFGEPARPTRTEQVAYYSAVLDSLSRAHPVLQLGRNWVIAHRPAKSEFTVVDSNFRLGKVIVEDRGLDLVIDWELAHVGDPPTSATSSDFERRRCRSVEPSPRWPTGCARPPHSITNLINALCAVRVGSRNPP